MKTVNDVNNVDELGYTSKEREFMFQSGAVWHNGSDVTKRGWYLQWQGSMQMTESDRRREAKSPFGIFLGTDLNKAKKAFDEL